MQGIDRNSPIGHGADFDPKKKNDASDELVKGWGLGKEQPQSTS